jgi:hypothetical protein
MERLGLRGKHQGAGVMVQGVRVKGQGTVVSARVGA